MTVGELIKELSRYDKNKDVFIAVDFRSAMAESVKEDARMERVVVSDL